ncbi:MAG: glycoside hydrolase family 3 N-terminal domain-containing protein [Pseudomonadota bacterium]
MNGQGACILAPAATNLSPGEVAFFRQADPWGFILFARNIDTPDQVRALTASLREAVGRDAPIFIDQEGGRVQRMGPPHWRQWLPPLEEANSPLAPASFYYRAKIIAQELRAVGINANCVPCLDVATPKTHPFLRNRCLGTTADQVAQNAQGVIDGSLSEGVMPVIKHMPGHGRSLADSHNEVPRVCADRATLGASDFAVCRKFAHMRLGMTGHIIFDAIDPRPATLSPVLIDLIRQDIGFDGLLMTDDISMGALSGSIAQRSTAAIAAGCDLVLHCNGEMAEMEAVVAATGRLTDAGQTRADAALAAWNHVAPGDIDTASLVAMYEQSVKENDA